VCPVDDAADRRATGVRRRSARGPGRPDDATRVGAGTAAARRVSGHPARAAEPQALQLHTLPGSSRVLLSDRYYDVRSPSAAVLCTHSSHCLILLPQWYAATHRQAPARQPEASSQSDQVELIKLHDRRVAEQRNASLQERHTPRLASWLLGLSPRPAALRLSACPTASWRSRRPSADSRARQ